MTVPIECPQVTQVMNKADFAEHLRFFQELGVTGINADQAWRRRVEPDVFPVAVARSGEEALRAIRDEIGDCTRCKLQRWGAGRSCSVSGIPLPI